MFQHHAHSESSNCAAIVPNHRQKSCILKILLPWIKSKLKMRYKWMKFLRKEIQVRSWSPNIKNWHRYILTYSKPGKCLITCDSFSFTSLSYLSLSSWFWIIAFTKPWFMSRWACKSTSKCWKCDRNTNRATFQSYIRVHWTRLRTYR